MLTGPGETPGVAMTVFSDACFGPPASAVDWVAVEAYAAEASDDSEGHSSSVTHRSLSLGEWDRASSGPDGFDEAVPRQSRHLGSDLAALPRSERMGHGAL